MAILLITALVLVTLPLVIGLLFRSGIQNFFFSVVLILIYTGISLIALFPGELDLDGPATFLLIFPVLIIFTITATAVCFLLESDDMHPKEESFYDDLLFFRYGHQLKSEVIPVGLKEDFDEPLEVLTNRFFHHLKTHLTRRFGTEDRNYATELISVRDIYHQEDPRIFIKSLFRTERNSYLAYFVNLSPIGLQIGITTLAFVRSSFQWHDVLLFLVSAPIHYWFWIYNWVRGKFSIRSRLGQIYPLNSLDRLEIEAFLKTATFSIMRSIEDFAKENNLMTEELRQVLINNINNTQNIQISRSNRIRLGKMKITNSTNN